MTPFESIQILQQRMNASIIGQENIVERLIIGLLANGNLLVEGLPDLAFVAIAEGNVTIPAQESLWWNSQTKKV